MPRWNRALVTGASSGIGTEMARLLADDGTDLVIVARDTARLEALAGELAVDTEVLTADLSDPTDVARVAARLGAESSPIDLLVNNAGLGFVGRFTDLDAQREGEVVQVNAVAVHQLCHAAAKSMVAAGRGGILNVASVTAFIPSAEGATYAATKSFVVMLSESLHLALAPVGVHVTALCPGFTRTEFQARAGYDVSDIAEFRWQDADAVARLGLAGVAEGRPRVVTGARNKVATTAIKVLPTPVTRMILRRRSTSR